LHLLRSGQVDVALVFRYLRDGTPVAADLEEEEGARSRLLLDEPVHLVSQAAGGGPVPAAEAGLAAYAGHRWIAGCESCRAHLLWQCELAGFTPLISFTTDDVLVAQALAAAGLGVAMLPDLALRAARHPAIRVEPLAGARRHVLAFTYGEPPDPPAVGHLLDALTKAATPARAPAQVTRAPAQARRPVR
jgi:DNA-binding transcriptional LysR family regulator